MLQCHTSHSGSPLQYQYNSGPCQVPQSTCDWHPGTLESVNLTTQDHVWSYRTIYGHTIHYDNKTEQFDEACHHPTDEILKYNSKGSVVTWSVGNVFESDAIASLRLRACFFYPPITTTVVVPPPPSCLQKSRLASHSFCRRSDFTRFCAMPSDALLTDQLDTIQSLPTLRMQCGKYY